MCNLALPSSCLCICLHVQAHPRRVARVARQLEREVGTLLSMDPVRACRLKVSYPYWLAPWMVYRLEQVALQLEQEVRAVLYMHSV